MFVRPFIGLFVCVHAEGFTAGVGCRSFVFVWQVTTVSPPHVTVTSLTNFLWCHKSPSPTTPSHGLTQKPGVSQKKAHYFRSGVD